MKKHSILQPIFLVLLVSGLLFVFSACTTHKMYLSESNLEKSEPITIGDYIVVSQFEDPEKLTWANEPVAADSLFSIFLQSVSSLGLPLTIAPNAVNQIDALDERRENGKSIWMNTEKIDTNAIKSLFPSGKGTTLIPVITIQNEYESGSECFSSVLNFSAFIIRDGKLVYFNTCTFFDTCRSIITKMHIDHTNRSEWPKHSQKDWDKLVSAVMESFTDKVVGS